MTITDRTAPEIHEVQFARNTRTGMWRAVCSCGWFLVGDETEVQGRAATHDLEWVSVEPEKALAE